MTEAGAKILRYHTRIYYMLQMSCPHYNKPGPAHVGTPLKFLKYAEHTIFKLLPISQCRKIPQGIRIRLGNQFFPN